MNLLKEFISKEIKCLLNESYKLTFQDKQELENKIRDEYKKYVEDTSLNNKIIQNNKRFLAHAKENFSKEDYEVLLKDLEHYLYLEPNPIMRYNEFYSKNKDSITNDFMSYKANSATSNFEYPMNPVNDAEKYYRSLSPEELKAIKNFIRIVGIRINSGAGESIDRREVRNAFFKTPIKFQKMFSEKPNPYLWRGDYAHPSDEDYDKEDKDYLAMQSFSIYKHTAQFFGSSFSAVNIKSYGGSFSVPKFLEYGDSDLLGNFDLADDEGEVMFFDVTYK